MTKRVQCTNATLKISGSVFCKKCKKHCPVNVQDEFDYLCQMVRYFQHIREGYTATFHYVCSKCKTEMCVDLVTIQKGETEQ